MAYAIDIFDWTTIAWDDLMAAAFNGGTYGDYIEEEMVPDPEADPVVGPDEADEIVTAEFGNLVTTFMRECYEALAGVREILLRESGGQALSIGAIADGEFVQRDGTSLVGSTAASIVVAGSGRAALARNTTLVDVDNTTDETDLVNYTIPANTLDVNGRKVVIEQFFDHLNNGATRSITLRWYVGGVLVHEGTAISFGSNATRHPLTFTTHLISLGATQQSLWVTGVRAGSTTPPATGQGGQLGTAGTPFVLWGNDSVADRTGTINVRVTIQHSAATSNQRTRQPFYMVSVE